MLTLMRICLMPFLVAAILEAHYALGFILFVIAGLTDALDGALARLLKQRTMLGQYLDPVADKLLLSALFLTLTYKGMMPIRVTVLVFGRDVGILVSQPFSMRRSAGETSAPAPSAKPIPRPRWCAVAAVLMQAMLHDHRIVIPWVAIRAMGAMGNHGADRGIGPALRMDSVAPARCSGEPRSQRQVRHSVLRPVLNVVRNVFFFIDGFFNLHIAKLFGVKDLATIQALDKFGVFVPGNDSYLGCLQAVAIARFVG